MPYPVRFQLYDDPSRETYTQLIPDVVADELPAYGYGKVIQVENDGSTSGPYYVVANISRIKREPDPDHPGESRIVYEVYLAREKEWGSLASQKILSVFVTVYHFDSIIKAYLACSQEPIFLINTLQLLASPLHRYLSS